MNHVIPDNDVDLNASNHINDAVRNNNIVGCNKHIPAR